MIAHLHDSTLSPFDSLAAFVKLQCELESYRGEREDRVFKKMALLS